jgi:phosphotriesterase-related protein
MSNRSGERFRQVRISHIFSRFFACQLIYVVFIIVLGLVEPNDLGKTLVHEHLSMNFEVAYVQPDEVDGNKINLPFSLENLGWIRYKPYSHRSNLLLNDADCEEAIVTEMQNYKQLGGGSLVECTTHGIYRKAAFLREISQKTGLNIIAGTGYYVAASFRDEALLSLPIEKLVEVIRSEIIDGCAEAADVRCGIIGEIGCSWPLHRNIASIIIKHYNLKC